MATPPATTEPARPELPSSAPWDELSLVDFGQEEPFLPGLFNMGDRMLIGGGAKTRKTWFALQMAVCLATGKPFLGFQPPRRFRVLYVNFELQTRYFVDRMRWMSRVLGAPTDGYFNSWNLRGHAMSMHHMRKLLKQEVCRIDGELAVLDPSYKLLGDADENLTRDVAALLNELDGFQNDTGCGVAAVHHFPKGPSNGKVSIDRFAGASAWARDPDVLLTLTAKDGESDPLAPLVVETTCRHQSPVPAFLIQWRPPLFVRDDTQSPDEVIKLLRNQGRPAKWKPEDVLPLFVDGQPATYSELRERAKEMLGMSKSTLTRTLDAAKNKGVVKHEDGKYLPHTTRYRVGSKGSKGSERESEVFDTGQVQ